LGLSKSHNDAVGEPEDQGRADQNNKVGSKKDHDKKKRVFKIIGRYKQLDAIIQEKGSYQYQDNLTD
jgi:hypothetical protein